MRRMLISEQKRLDAVWSRLLKEAKKPANVNVNFNPVLSSIEEAKSALQRLIDKAVR